MNFWQMPNVRRLTVASISVIALTATQSAYANGRFPDAQQLVVEPDDESHIAVQTTYGFIQTRDAGANWTWVCEDAAGYGGILDPPITITQSSRLVAGVFDGLSVSTPDGCDYAFIGGELEGRFFTDVSTLKNDPTHVIALSSDGLGQSMFDTRVWKSLDSGETWAPIGSSLPSNFLGLTIDAAPGNENLLYISGFQIVGNVYNGMLAVSQNNGDDWELLPIEGSGNNAGPYIAAISPVDTQTVYVRLSSLEGVLLVTHDGGVNWEQVYKGTGTLLGFALSPDGTQVRVGGPDDGIWAASTADHTFTKINDTYVRCLTWTNHALYVCGREAFDAFTIARSFDGGVTLEPLHNLACLDGPDPACGENSSINQMCPGPWAAQKQLLATDTCVNNGGAGGQGTGGSSGGNGSGGSDGSDEGCSCTTAGDNPMKAWLPLIAIAAFAARARRRARRGG